MGVSRVRTYIVVAALALVAVNLLVFLYVGPSMSTIDPIDDTLPKEEGEEPPLDEEPEVIEDVEGPEPGDEPKG